MSKYISPWTRFLRRHKIRETLDRLRQREVDFPEDDAWEEFDVLRVRPAGDREPKHWNVRIKINRSGKVSGNAAHLNCLGKMVQDWLRPKEHLYLETKVDGEDGLKLFVYFEKISDEDVSTSSGPSSA